MSEDKSSEAVVAEASDKSKKPEVSSGLDPGYKNMMEVGGRQTPEQNKGDYEGPFKDLPEEQQGHLRRYLELSRKPDLSADEKSELQKLFEKVEPILPEKSEKVSGNGSDPAAEGEK